jgi:hypothetical protein
MARPVLAIAACLWLAATPVRAGDVPAAPEDGGPRHFAVTGVTTALNLREGWSLDAAVAAELAPGAILTNLGCEAGEGRVWCKVQPFGGGPVGFVDAAFLAPAKGPDGGVATGPNDSAYRAGKGEFDAMGELPCAVTVGQPTVPCPFGVARAGGGDATVIVTRPGGMTRAIFFVRGVAIGTDTAEADPASFEFGARKEADLHFVRVGSERYEIPDAVIFGG